MAREKKLKCMRMMLLVFNALYSISGGILLGLGIWAAIEKLFISHIIGSYLYSIASYLIIAVGAVLLLVSFLGCLGICIEIRCMLMAYFILLLTIFLCLVLSAILAIVFKGEIEGTMKDAMKENLITKYSYIRQGYQENRDITEAWDITQQKFNCCAVDAGPQYNYKIYRQTSWFKNIQTEIDSVDTVFVPKSCCKTKFVNGKVQPINLKQCQSFQLGPPRHDHNWASNDALLYNGCFKAGREYVMKQSSIVLAVAITFAFCLVVGMVLALCVWKNIPPSDYGPTASGIV